MRSIQSSGWLFIFLIIFLFKPTPVNFLGPEIGMKIPDVMFVFIMILYLSVHRVIVRLGAITYTIAFLVVFELLSQVIGATSHDIVINDLVELIRWPIFLLALICGYSMGAKSEKIIFSGGVLIVFILFIVFSMVLFFDFSGSKEIIANFYEVGKSRGHSEINVYNIWRLSSTFTNPNYFSFFCSTMVIWFFYCFLTIGKLRNAVFFLAFLGMLLLTGSRTGLVSFFVVFTCIIFLDFFTNGLKSSRSKWMYGSMLTSLIFVIPFVVEFLSKLLWRYANTKNIQVNIDARILAWKEVMGSISENILFGVGSNKSEVSSIDSNYVLLLYKNGLLGLLLVLFLFFLSFRVGYKLYIKSNKVDSYDNRLSVLLLVSTSVMLIGMLTAIPFYMTHLSVPFIFILGYTESIYRKRYV
jgi:hypothetical protein